MRYVALLRGIGPGNPNMHGSKLCSVFEKLGFTDVVSVISSGNVIFDSPSKNIVELESEIEKALPKYLDFKSTTIIRSEDELKNFVKSDPFRGIKDEKPNYLVVTFFKDRKKELCSVIDMTDGTNTGGGFMAKLERQHGKLVTTRTWKTVGRILKKMEEIR